MVGERIKKVRQTANLTQQEFADRLQIKRGAIANYEIGRNTPIDAVISLICREFNVNETWLRTGEGEMITARNRSQILADYIDECMNKPESFKARFAEGMAKLTDEQWEQVAKIVETIFEQKK